MPKNIKTNAMRVLEKAGIEYRTHSYTYDEDHLDAIHAAKSAGLELEKVFKTIVMINNDKELFVFVLPAEFEISLKKARSVTGSKDIELLKTSELQKHTGYIRGGCSPIAMTHKYKTYIEETALLEEHIYVSAGVRGTQLELDPNDLQKVLDATFADFC